MYIICSGEYQLCWEKKNDNYTDCVGSSPEVCGKMVIMPILLIMSFVKPFRKCEWEFYPVEAWYFKMKVM